MRTPNVKTLNAAAALAEKILDLRFVSHKKKQALLDELSEVCLITYADGAGVDVSEFKET